MVHTGRPSRGCGVCRRRRIKCDEKSPECSYCVKTKQKCPGYKDLFDLAWRDQTSIAQKNVERRKRASPEQATPKVDFLPGIDPKAASGGRSPLTIKQVMTIVPPTLSEDPEAYALGFFFGTYASPPLTIYDRKGFLEYVGPQFVNAKPDSALKMATMAISSFLFVAWLDRRPDNPMSRGFYLKALSIIKDRIRQPDGCADNDVLTSVLLLQMYEMLVGTVNRSGNPRAHLDGALALIKHRGAENFQDDIGQSLLHYIRSQLIEEAFRNGEPISDDVSTWKEHLTGPKASPGTFLDNINVELANLEASARQRAALPPFLRADLNPQEILQKAQDIERQLIEWSETLPLFWMPVRVVGGECIPKGMKAAGLYQSHCYIYPSLSVASLWNKQRVSRIKVNNLIRQELSQQSSSSKIDMIQQLTDDICASVPFMLGDKVKPSSMGDKRVQYPHAPGQEVPSAHYTMAPAMGGFWLLGPLQMMMGLRIGMREGQKQWVGGQLMRIAHIYNIGK